MSHEEQKPPSIFRMMKSFTKDLTKYIKEGAPNVSPESYAMRLDICNGCETWFKSYPLVADNQKYNVVL